MNKPVNLLTPAQILDSLRALKLEGMAELFPDVATNPQFQNLTFEELFGILVEHECTVQRIKRATRCLKRSGLQELEVFNQADLDKAIFAKERNLQESQVRKLLTCNWITEPPAYSLLVTGATGTGKTWLLALLGKAACCWRPHDLPRFGRAELPHPDA